jgi:hypothetical protein
MDPMNGNRPEVRPGSVEPHALAASILLLGALLLALTAGSQAAHALLIVDTGQPGTGNPIFFGGASRVFHAAEFTTASDYTITSVEAFMQNVSGETATISIQADSGDVPGATIHFTPFTGSSNSAAWQGASGLSWDVPAGTYWVSFGPAVGQTVAGDLLQGAPSPLVHEATRNTAVGGWFSNDGLDLGVRIDAIPEPSTALLLATGLAALALRRRLSA